METMLKFVAVGKLKFYNYVVYVSVQHRQYKNTKQDTLVRTTFKIETMLKLVAVGKLMVCTLCTYQCNRDNTRTKSKMHWLRNFESMLVHVKLNNYSSGHIECTHYVDSHFNAKSSENYKRNWTMHWLLEPSLHRCIYYFLNAAFILDNGSSSLSGPSAGCVAVWTGVCSRSGGSGCGLWLCVPVHSLSALLSLQTLPSSCLH